MMKRYIAILSIILIAAIQLYPVLSVNATEVTVEGTFGDAISGYTLDDMLSRENYNMYYDTVEDGLKNAVVNTFIGNNTDSTLGNNIFTNITNTWQNDNWDSISYYPSVTGKKLFCFFVGPNYTPMFNACTVVSDNDVYIVGNTVVSSSSFEYYWIDYSYSFGVNGFTYTPYIYNGDSKHHVQSSYNQANNYYYIDTGGYLFYSELPVYFLYNLDNEYQDLLYLGESPYNYHTLVGVFSAIGNDETGFVVDRRTSHMITATGGGQVVSPSQYGFKQGSFGNILYGSDTFNQKLMVGYQLNDASSTIQDDLYLKLNYEYIFDGLIWSQHIYFDEDYYSNAGRYDLYSLSNNNYVNVDLNKIFDTLYENDGDYDTNLGTVLTMAQGSIVQSSQRPQKVLDKTATNLLNILFNNDLLTGYPVSVEYDYSFFDSVSLTYKNITVSPKFNLNAITMGTQSLSYTNRLDNVEIIVTESIYNIKTGDESTPYTFIYNYLDGTYQDLGTLETQNELFTEYQYGGQSLSSYTADDINFDIAKGQYYPGTQAYGGSSNSSVGNITVYAGTNSVSKVFIDMPMEEALEHTPNLAQLYSDMKSGFLVSTDNSQSIIQLTKDTYTFIPAEIWGYITICVVTCCGLAVYRNFRGR